MKQRSNSRPSQGGAAACRRKTPVLWGPEQKSAFFTFHFSPFTLSNAVRKRSAISFVKHSAGSSLDGRSSRPAREDVLVEKQFLAALRTRSVDLYADHAASAHLFQSADLVQFGQKVVADLGRRFPPERRARSPPARRWPPHRPGDCRRRWFPTAPDAPRSGAL